MNSNKDFSEKIKKYSILEPDDIRKFINQLPEIIFFLYGIHASSLQKTITEKVWKKESDFSTIRMIWFKIQTSIYLFQSFKHYEKTSWFLL